MKGYRIQAICTNPCCPVTEFTSARKRSTYTSTDGHEYPVQRIVCPECKCWGEVLRIEKIEEVAA
mgnify:CR=1 FL=1